MSRVEIRQVVAAPPAEVWRELADLASHVEWMADADSITFTGDRRTGVGTRFDCVTRIGPLHTVDRMEVTSWREGEEIGVDHQGLVQGVGRFTLRPLGPDRTEVSWAEQLRFRWYLGGPVAALVAMPVLRWVWRRNLRRLAARLEPA